MCRSNLFKIEVKEFRWVETSFAPFFFKKIFGLHVRWYPFSPEFSTQTQWERRREIQGKTIVTQTGRLSRNLSEE